MIDMIPILMMNLLVLVIAISEFDLTPFDEMDFKRSQHEFYMRNKRAKYVRTNPTS